MNALIPLTDNDGAQAVMGRDLHGFLEIGKDYSTWFKDMCRYGFSAGQDFSPILGNINRAGRPRIDHIVSLDMAKEISMIQRTDKGKQARQYFIECERQSKNPAQGVELSRMELIHIAMNAEEERLALESKVAEDAPKVEYHDKFVAANDDVMTVGDWGAHYGLTQPQAFHRLVESKIIYRKAVAQEFSDKRGQVVDRNEYRAYAAYRNLFELRAQHNAPRYHNGQVRQTLYVKAGWAFNLANQPGLEDLQGNEIIQLPL